MKFSTILSSMTCFLMVTTSTQAMMELNSNPIPLDPEEELSKLSVRPDRRENDFLEGQQSEAEKKFDEAASAYKRAGANGHSEAFIRLGYLYEEGKVVKRETVEERRLIDAIAGFYIEKGVEKGASPLFFSQVSQFHSAANLEDDEEGESLGISLSEIQEDHSLKEPEKSFKIAQWYENQRKAQETIAQKRLRYAYAGRYYEQAALWHFHPKAYTALGHMYYFGKGIDISDSTTSLTCPAPL